MKRKKKLERKLPNRGTNSRRMYENRTRYPPRHARTCNLLSLYGPYKPNRSVSLATITQRYRVQRVKPPYISQKLLSNLCQGLARAEGQGRQTQRQATAMHTEERSSAAVVDTGTECCIHCTLFGVPHHSL